MSVFKATTKRPLRHKLIIALVILTMLLPANFMYPKKAEALFGGLSGGALEVTQLKNTVEQTINTINTGLTQIGVTSLALKDGWWDGVFGMAAKVFLRSVVRSIVTWINSGFQGAPAFVTDLKGFMLDVADETMGEFIYNEPGLNFLCSPFQLDVKIALETTYSASRGDLYEPKCTLTGVADNVEDFLSGSFSSGGWPAYFEMTQNEVNTPMGAYLSAQGEAYARIINAQGEEIKKLDFGDGFFSMEICDVAEKASGAKPNCTIGTPGSVIANSINKALGAPQDELIAADEVNEIFNALFSQLVTQVFNGAYGLLGLGGSSSYTDYTWDDTSTTSSSNTSYLDAIAEADEDLTLDTSLVESIIPMSTALESEEEYAALSEELIGRVESAEIAYENTKNTLGSSGCSLGIVFPETLTNAKAEAELAVANSETAIDLLSLLNETFANSSSTDLQEEALSVYAELDDSDLLHTATDVVYLEQYIDYDLESTINDLYNELDRAVDQCNDD